MKRHVWCDACRTRIPLEDVEVIRTAETWKSDEQTVEFKCPDCGEKAISVTYK